MFQYGTFHRISSPFSEDGNVTSWTVVSTDQTEAIVARYQWSEIPNDGFKRLYFKGLREDFEYVITGIEGTFYGDELMHIGLVLDNPRIHKHQNQHPSDFSAQLFHIKKI